MTARTSDVNGYVEITGNPISKIGVYPYLGSEIGADEPDRIYKVYRPESELASEETIASFRLMPIIDEHTVLGSEDEGLTPAERKGVQGALGQDIHYDRPYLRGTLKLFSESAKELVRSGTRRELSPGYRCRYDFSPGVFDGQVYDAIQRDIRANHLALVTEGRTGPDVAVLDHAGALCALDSATVLEALKMADETTVGAPDALAEIKAMLSAILERLAPKDDEEVVDEAKTEVKDEDKTDEAKTEEVKDEEVKTEEAPKAMDAMRKQIARLEKQLTTAQDSGAVMASIADRDALAQKLSGFIGTFDHAAMTAKQVAVYGLDKLGVKTDPGTERVAIDAWLHGRTPDYKKPTYAADTGSNVVDLNKLWKEA